MIKVAIPLSENLLSSSINDCSYFSIFYIDNREIKEVNKAKIHKGTDDEILNWLTAQNITDLIVHKISKKLLAYLSETKMNLFVGVEYKSSEQLIGEYLNGTLQSDSRKLKELK